MPLLLRFALSALFRGQIKATGYPASEVCPASDIMEPNLANWCCGGHQSAVNQRFSTLIGCCQPT
eukprot:scaffold8330_cov18-Prasinocladus_malaysianus.AAC.1